MYKDKYFFLLPGVIVLIAIVAFPLFFIIRVSFSSWSVSQPALNYIGWKNYINVFNDIRFWSSLVRLSALVVSSVLVEYVIGFLLALAVWRNIRFRRFFRILFLVPMMVTPAVMAVIWRTIFNQSLGPANNILRAIGLHGIPWLTNGSTALLSLLIVQIWQWTPFMFLLLLAGLVSLPREPYLAAEIDGAGPIRTFFQVTFPLLVPITISAIIIRLIEASKIMATVYVMTSGGPGTATETTSYYLYIKGLREFQIGYAGSLGVVYLVIMIISLTIIYKAMVKASAAYTA